MQVEKPKILSQTEKPKNESERHQLLKQVEQLEKVIVKQQSENRDMQKKLTKLKENDKLKEELIRK